MSNNTRTVHVHTNNPVSSDELHDHIYHGVARVHMEGSLTLYNENDKPIAQYQEHAWESWNVIPGNNNSAEQQFTKHVSKYSKRASTIGFRDDTGKLTGLLTGDGVIDEEEIQKRLDDKKSHLESRLDKIEEMIGALACNKHIIYHSDQNVPFCSEEEMLSAMQESSERAEIDADHKRS